MNLPTAVSAPLGEPADEDAPPCPSSELRSKRRMKTKRKSLLPKQRPKTSRLRRRGLRKRPLHNQRERQKSPIPDESQNEWSTMLRDSQFEDAYIVNHHLTGQADYRYCEVENAGATLCLAS